MKWFDSLLGRSTRQASEQDDEPFAFPVANAVPNAPRNNLPAFRQSASPLAFRGGEISASDARTLIRDAFTPSQPVTERSMFAGRRALLESLIVAIEDQKLHFVLYGDRGIGKTSILRLLSGLAQDAGYLVCYISCGEELGFSEFARRVAERTPLLHHRDYAPGSPEIEQGLRLSDVIPDTIGVSTFGEHLGKLTDTRLIIMLDEFDRVDSDGFRKSIAELIKMLSDNAANAQIVIAGVASNLTELIAQIPSIRRNIIGVMVPNMSDEEVGEMLDFSEKRSGLQFTPEARELVALASLGLPYLVGLVAQHAAFITTDRGEVKVGKTDVRAAIRKARADLAGRTSAATLRAITEASQTDHFIEISKLAHNALRSGGTLPPDLVGEHLREAKTDDREDLRLLEPIEGDPLERWRFRDDGASVYIWLTALCAE